MLACCEGRLGDALRLATAALQAAERQDTAAELVDLEARLVLAQVFVERNQLDAAWRQLQAALRLYWLSGATSCMWAVELDLARVLVAQGLVSEAIHRLEPLRTEAAGFLSPAMLRKLNQLLIECRLALRDVERALVIANSVSSRHSSRTLARLDPWSGRPDLSIDRLGTGTSSNLAVEIRRLVLLACAERMEGHPGRARIPFGGLSRRADRNCISGPSWKRRPTRSHCSGA